MWLLQCSMYTYTHVYMYVHIQSKQSLKKLTGAALDEIQMYTHAHAYTTCTHTTCTHTTCTHTICTHTTCTHTTCTYTTCWSSLTAGVMCILLAHWSVFLINMATVIGPTPPGTGVIQPATCTYSTTLYTTYGGGSWIFMNDVCV